MKIKAKKQRAFNTSTMTSSSNYNEQNAEEIAEEIGVAENHTAKKNRK
ncbi:hypothetical protein [Desulfotomaculum sp. 1211_IL3151]